MAYVPGFDNDVFVSYAHIDNEDLRRDRTGGWVDAVASELELQLRRRVGSDAVKVWTDYDLPTNKPITPELLKQVEASALILLIMSRSYLNSEWCARERNAFLAVAKSRIAEDRVFIVQYLDVDRGKWPREFGDYTGEKFWISDPQIHGHDRPLGIHDRREPAFVQKIYDLSVKMAKVLDTLLARNVGDTAIATYVGPVVEQQASVFVARATDDLDEREQELRNQLIQAGFRVPARRVYGQATREEFEAAVLADLAGCRLFAQVLGPIRGTEVPFDPTRRLPALLADVAKQQGVPILQWRDRLLDLKSIMDPLHRELVEAAVACPIEEFKRMVVDAASKRPEQAAPARQLKVVVFVDRTKEDHALAVQVKKLLESEGIAARLPLDEDEADWFEDFKRELTQADGVLEVFGVSELASVRARLGQHKKILSDRPADIPVQAILEGPPGDHEKLAKFLERWSDPDVLVIDSAEGVKKDDLANFITRLREAHNLHG